MGQEIDCAGVAEQELLAAALPLISSFGWTSRLVQAAAREAGLSRGEAELLLPHGARDLAALLARRADERALALLATLDPQSLKIRERIRSGVLARCAAAMENETATRRWMGFLVLPPNVGLGLRLLWASADSLWRWAGDTAADENHYSKRVLLAEILATTLAIRLTADAAAAERHLDSRIERVMAFERWKARAPRGLGARLATRLGHLRYGDSRAQGADAVDVSHLAPGLDLALAIEPEAAV